MSLCSSCEVLDLENREQCLGEYSEMLVKADEGCEACRFFILVLQSNKKDISKLSGCVVFLSSNRLDCRKPEELDCRSYCCDDLLLDLCKTDTYTGAPPNASRAPRNDS
jgi:hypothetical protein